MADYDLGDIVVLQAIFSVSAVTCTLTVLLPDGTTATPTAGTSDNLTWTATYLPALAGPYWYRFAGTGAVAAQEGTFTVRALRTVTAGPTSLDVLTYDEALNAITVSCSGTSNVNTDSLGSMITAVSREMDRLCGPIVNRARTDRLDGAGKTDVMTFRRPIFSITSVTEYYVNTPYVLTEEIPGSATTRQYRMEARHGRLWRRESTYDTFWAPGRGNVVVVYTAGRFASTAAVDSEFKQAAKLAVANLWRREFGMRGPDAPLAGATFGLPDAARDLLRGEMLMEYGIA
jgi:hypothetical protein